MTPIPTLSPLARSLAQWLPAEQIELRAHCEALATYHSGASNEAPKRSFKLPRPLKNSAYDAFYNALSACEYGWGKSAEAHIGRIIRVIRREPVLVIRVAPPSGGLPQPWDGRE